MDEAAMGPARSAAIRLSASHQYPQHQESALAAAAWRPASLSLPFTAFSEYEDNSPKGKKVIRWFAPPDRGMLFFAGICSEWYGDYGSKKEPNVGTHKVFSFLTTEPNDLIRPVHEKAMPVVLRSEAERWEWLTGPSDQIERIQARVLAADVLEILPDDEAAPYAGGYLKSSRGSQPSP
jgi:putative SOS response-associated peptidase YedK